MNQFFDPVARLRYLEEMEGSAKAEMDQLHQEQINLAAKIKNHANHHSILLGEITSLRMALRAHHAFREKLAEYDAEFYPAPITVPVSEPEAPILKPIEQKIETKIEGEITTESVTTKWRKK